MSTPRGAFAIAQALLPGVELSPGQLAQLRALDREYYQRLYALQHSGAAGGERVGPVPDESTMAQLDAALASSIRDMLTQAQRREFDRNWAQSRTERGSCADAP